MKLTRCLTALTAAVALSATFAASNSGCGSKYLARSCLFLATRVPNLPMSRYRYSCLQSCPVDYGSLTWGDAP